jgi:selenocysteine-specific translation elongation factor
VTIASRILSWFGLMPLLFMTPGCGDISFKFKVDDVFYVTTIDRVIVTGTVSSGIVKPGDKLIVRNGSTDISVTVERLEHPTRKVESAAAGDQVGLVLVGIRKDQVRSGDIVLRL